MGELPQPVKEKSGLASTLTCRGEGWLKSEAHLSRPGSAYFFSMLRGNAMRPAYSFWTQWGATATIPRVVHTRLAA